MSAVVSLRRTTPPGSTRSLSGSFGERKLPGGVRKSEGVMADQSATFFVPPSIEKYAAVGAFGVPNRRLPGLMKRTRSSAETEVTPSETTLPSRRPMACPISCRMVDILRLPGGRVARLALMPTEPSGGLFGAAIPKAAAALGLTHIFEKHRELVLDQLKRPLSE